MQLRTFALAVLATAAHAQSQCTTNSYTGEFSLNPVNVTTSGKRSIEERQNTCSSSNALRVTLQNGVLKDSQGRIGSIVANYQFQFDGPPPQAGAMVVDGYSICGNNSLASNGQAIWYQCSDNTRTSIYGPKLTPIGAACYQVYYTIIPCGSSSSGGAAVGTLSDGQPTVTSSACVPVTTLSDGQPVVSTCPPTSTCVPVTTLSDGQPVVSSCPTAAPTSTCVPITTLSDGQPIVSSCPTVAPKSTCVPVTTLSDGQPVVSSCPTSPATATATAVNVVTQSRDGQVGPTGSIIVTSTPTSFLTVNGGQALRSGSLIGAAVAAAFALFIL